jgi:hypothetical protein
VTTPRDRLGLLTDTAVSAAAGLVDAALDKVLVGDRRVTSAAEGKGILASDDDLEGLSDHVQRFVGVATPTLRALGRGARFSRMPWALIASSAVSVTVTTRVGVRELQVIGSFVAHRLELATGTAPDPALVKKIAVELYVDPRSTPDVSERSLRLHRVMRRWLTAGALGTDTRRRAYRSLDAVEKLDARGLATRWAAETRRPRGDVPVASGTA